VHSIAYGNPETMLGGKFLDGPWDDVAQACTSRRTPEVAGRACAPLMSRGGSVVGMTFDATVAWPGVRLDGRGQGGLESTSRYLARDLGPEGIRVNLVSAGPLKTLAAKAIPGFEEFEERGGPRPAGWDPTDLEPTAAPSSRLLSDFFPATTGEIVHVDGGYPRWGGSGHVLGGAPGSATAPTSTSAAPRSS
jgi:enoyl-[acyl-carrier protein] reductase I